MLSGVLPVSLQANPLYCLVVRAGSGRDRKTFEGKMKKTIVYESLEEMMTDTRKMNMSGWHTECITIKPLGCSHILESLFTWRRNVYTVEYIRHG